MNAEDDLDLLSNTSPFLHLIGARLIGWEPGRAQFAVELGADHMNRGDVLHGGVAATLLDAACGYCGLRVEGEAEARRGATTMLAISYLSTTSSGRLVATATVTRATRTIYFASGELRADDGQLLATAQGSFKYLR